MQKKLTLSAQTFPMRVATSELACGFSFETFTQNYEATKFFDFQYIKHLVLMKNY